MFLYFNLENMLGKISYELCNNSFDYILSVFYMTSYVLHMYYISYASKTNGIFPFPPYILYLLIDAVTIVIPIFKVV